MTPRGFLSAFSPAFALVFLGMDVVAATGAGGESFSKENAGMSIPSARELRHSLKFPPQHLVGCLLVTANRSNHMIASGFFGQPGFHPVSSHCRSRCIHLKYENDVRSSLSNL